MSTETTPAVRSTSTRHRPRAVLAALATLAVCAGPAWSAGNLVPQTVSFEPNPLQSGNCSKVGVQVRNSGDQLINTITKVMVIVFPTATPNQNRVEKALFVSALGAGATSPLQWASGLALSGSGQHTVQVVVDADQQIQEANENDNISTQFTNIAAACGGSLCDLKSTISFPTYSSLPGNQPAKLTVAMSNVGGTACLATAVNLERYTGTSATGSATKVASESLSPLAPSATKSIYLTDDSHPATGIFTYKIGYGSPFTDADNSNHYPVKTVTFTSAPGPGCDLAAEFQPALPTSTTGGGYQSFGVRFSNVGTDACADTKAKLVRYSGSTCSGYGSQVGGSGAWQSVGALEPGKYTNVSFAEKNTSKGTSCYKLEYSGPFNDQNNANHQLQDTITYN